MSFSDVEAISTIGYTDNKSFFSQHMNYVKSLQKQKKEVKVESFFKGETERNFPYLDVFRDAFNSDFVNGHAKDFCTVLSLLCTEDLYISISNEMISYVQGFKLKRIRGRNHSGTPHSRSLEVAEIVTRSSSSRACEEWLSNNSGLKPTSHYTDGDSVCDCATRVTVDLKPALLYECKSNNDNSTINEGISQLVAYGLSLRHMKKLPHELKLPNELKLVMITPKFWFLMTLSPFDTPLPEAIDVLEYKIFCWDKKEKSLTLDTKTYIQFLLQLRQHFELFK